MQENIIQKLNTRAKKTLTLKEVKFDDVNFKKTTDYLLYQKLLSFSEINKILQTSGDKDFPIGNIIEDKEERIVGFMGAFYSKKKMEIFFSHYVIYIHGLLIKNIETILFFYSHHYLIMPLVLQRLLQSKVWSVYY